MPRPGAHTAACLLGALVISASAAPAQEEAPPELDERGVWYAGVAEEELGDLLEVCTLVVGAHVEYDPAAVAGHVVRLRYAPAYPGEELWELANRELARLDLTTVQPPGTDSFQVVPFAEAVNRARLDPPDLSGVRAGFAKVLLPLEHADPEELVDLATRLLSPGGTVEPVAAGGTERVGRALLLADLREHVREAVTVLSLLDRGPAAPEVLEVALEHVSPTTVKARLEQIVASQQQAGGGALLGMAHALPESFSILLVAPPSEISWWTEQVRRFDRPEPLLTREYVPRRFGLADTARLVEEVARQRSPDGWRMVEDHLTGTLILTTTPSQHERVDDLLERLEYATPGPRRVLRAFEIGNRQVSEVLELLQGLIDEGALGSELPGGVGGPAVEATQGSAAQDQLAARPVVGAPGDGTERVVVTADEGANRILAFGRPDLLDQLSLLIEDLDVRHAEILVEALVVNLTESETRDLGVELQRIGSVNGDAYQVASLFGLGLPDAAGGVIPPPDGTGFSGVVLDPGEYSALVRALETVNQGRTLNRPKVLVNNNQEATLDSVLQTPFLATNASDTVATTSLGGSEDAGTQILVKPQVADGDLVVLEYSVSLSAFVGDSADPALPPPKQENRLASVVTIPDGFTVVVGGLEIERETDAADRVPVLGEIPLLGALFQSRSRTRSTSRFWVFLRAEVVRGERFEGLKYASEREFAAAGVDDGRPKLAPRIMR